jgi:hypothetical protein
LWDKRVQPRGRRSWNIRFRAPCCVETNDDDAAVQLSAPLPPSVVDPTTLLPEADYNELAATIEFMGAAPQPEMEFVAVSVVTPRPAVRRRGSLDNVVGGGAEAHHGTGYVAGLRLCAAADQPRHPGPELWVWGGGRRGTRGAGLRGAERGDLAVRRDIPVSYPDSPNAPEGTPASLYVRD